MDHADGHHRTERALNQNIVDTLTRSTQTIHDAIAAEGSLAGQCERAAGDLADLLSLMGVDCLLAWGEYAHPCPQGYPSTGHCWVEVDGMLCDPTRGQFDDGPMIFHGQGAAAVPYTCHYRMLHSDIQKEADAMNLDDDG